MRSRKKKNKSGQSFLRQSLEQTGISSKAVKESSSEQIIVDTPVQPKAITSPDRCQTLRSGAWEIMVKLSRYADQVRSDPRPGRASP